MNQRGFTLIELISVMILLGVVLSIGAGFVIGRTSVKAENVMLATVLNHLNAYEMESWTNVKMSQDGWTSDQVVYDNLNVDRYAWQSQNQNGGVLIIREKQFTLKRNQSVSNKHGSWEVSS